MQKVEFRTNFWEIKNQLESYASISGSFHEGTPPVSGMTTYLNCDIAIHKDGSLLIKCPDYLWNRKGVVDELYSWYRDITHQAKVLKRFLELAEKEKLHPTTSVPPVKENSGGQSGVNTNIPQLDLEGA